MGARTQIPREGRELDVSPVQRKLLSGSQSPTVSKLESCELM